MSTDSQIYPIVKIGLDVSEEFDNKHNDNENYYLLEITYFLQDPFSYPFIS